MRIRVDLQLDKPLRRRGRVASDDGEKFWVNNLGKFIESDRRTGNSDQAKFMRIRVDL